MKNWNEQEVYSREAGFDQMISYDTSNREQYIGFAYPGSKTSNAVWSIFKLEYDGTTGGVSKKRYADGVDDFKKSWDLRSGYTYLDIT